MIAFLDASALIYLVEGEPPFGQRVREALAPLSEISARRSAVSLGLSVDIFCSNT